MRTFPIYLLELGDGLVLCYPEDRRDIDHSEFWETTASRQVAEHYKIPQRLLVNLPYCQRRARVAGNMVYYGETPDAKLLRLIRKALGNSKLVFVHDEHEQRLQHDVSEFRKLMDRFVIRRHRLHAATRRRHPKQLRFGEQRRHGHRLRRQFGVC
jgi:hypothetical protein